MIRAEAKGENEAACYIDFGWKRGKNSVLIHDHQNEHNGRVAAQADHLIIVRTLDFGVIEQGRLDRDVKGSQRSPRSPQIPRNQSGGGKGIRTPGLFIANEALYQLSYTPTNFQPTVKPATCLVS